MFTLPPYLQVFDGFISLQELQQFIMTCFYTFNTNFVAGTTTGSPECIQVLYSAQWDNVSVLKRCPTERYIKPVRIPGYLWHNLNLLTNIDIFISTFQYILKVLGKIRITFTNISILNFIKLYKIQNIMPDPS